MPLPVAADVDRPTAIKENTITRMENDFHSIIREVKADNQLMPPQHHLHSTTV